MDFDLVYKKYYRELYVFAIKQNQMQTEADDLIQDIFTAFYKQLKTGTIIENPRAWLYKVLLNSIRTEIKISHSRVEKNIEIASYTELSTETSSNYHDIERRKIVETCMQQLSVEERNLLFLYQKGFSYKEISEILKIGYSSVGTYIARATKKLKSILILQYHELFE